MIRRLNERMDGKTLLDKSIELARRLYGYTANYEMSSESRMDLQIELSKLIAMVEEAQDYYLNVKKESKSRTRNKKLNEGIETGEIVNDIQDCEYFIHILQKRLDEIDNLNEQIRTTRRAVDVDSIVTKANKYSTEMVVAIGRAMRQANLLQKELEEIVDKTDDN